MHAHAAPEEFANMNVSGDISGAIKMPYDIEVEQALLGSLIVDNKMIPIAAAVCDQTDFYDPLHRRLAEAIFTLNKTNRPVTPLILKAHMGDDVGLAEVGGYVYLTGLASAAPAMPRVDGLGRIVADFAMRRAAIYALEEARTELAEPPRRLVNEILHPVVRAADRAAERSNSDGSTGTAYASASVLVTALETGTKELLGTPVSTGISNLDALLGGFYPGNLYIAAGRPGMGKTTFGTGVAKAAANQNLLDTVSPFVLFFSMEMVRVQLTARSITDIDYDRFDATKERPLEYERLLKHRCSKAEIARARAALNLLESLNIEINDRRMTMAEVSALSRAAASRVGGRGIVIIDHLHIVKASDRYSGNRTSEITEITNEAKELAKALKWPVLMLCQLNREVEKRQGKDKAPTLADLRQSGSIEEDADCVMLLHRPAYYIKEPLLKERDPDWPSYLAEYEPIQNDLHIDVAKNRHGRTGLLKCWVDIGASAIRGRDPRAEAPPPEQERDLLDLAHG